MSWWDTKGFAGLASQALKTAQKQIDKVLDIEESEANRGKTSVKTGKSAPASQASSPGEGTSKDEDNSWNSWSSWMAPKAGGTGQEKEGSQSEGLSSWSFSWGSQADQSSSPAEASLSASSRSSQSVTSKSSSSVARKLNPPSGDSKHTVLSTKRRSSVSETESQKDVVSKTEKNREGESGSSCEETKDSHAEVQMDVRGRVREESLAERVGIPSEASGGEEQSAEDNFTMTSEQRVSTTGLIGSTFSGNEKDQAPILTSSESEGTIVSRLSQTSLSTNSNQSENVDVAEKNESELTEQESGKAPAGVHSEPVQVGEESSQGIGSAEDSELLKPESDNNTHHEEEAFETIAEESQGSETGESGGLTLTGVSETSFSSAVSGDGSFTQISSSENLQAMSITSVSSEPTLLSMSTEDGSASLQPEESGSDLNVFSPPSHSSLTLEDEQERKSPPPCDALSPLDNVSPVGSPPLDFTATPSSNDSSETSRLDSSVDTVIDQSQQLQEEPQGKEGGEEADSKHWLGDSAHTDLDDSTSPSASFVQCMIEDAMGMEDASRNEDSSSDNHSEEKSEGSKVDSEFEKGVYSGHESSDEIETTTSSDIEIISTPTPNGDKTNMVDLSPIKFSLQKAARSHGPGHHRTDSQSSSSTNSKGELEQMSPERDSDHEHHDWHREGKGPGQQQNSAAQQDDLDNPHHPQRLLKSCKNQQEKDFVKKLAEMAEVLQARESKLVQLSKDNNDLLETNSILRSQLQQAEETRETEMTDVNALTDEFTRRMGEAERKMQTILKEKESVKQQLQLAQNELASRSADVNLEAVLAEKDEQIAGLMEEGEKLSKQQLQNSNIIKKLRVKEKENEGLLTSQKKKLDQQKEELERLKVVLDSKEDMEKKQADAIKQLNSAVQMIEKEKIKLKVEVDSAEEKIRGLQATLDNSYKEIAELHKSNASQDSKAQQAALSAEMQVREELKMAMEEENQRFRQERDALIMQIEDLRLSLARMEKDHNRREEMLKQEISDLQMRLQEDESRNQDLTQSVTSATRPLLRQIENLQATHSMQSAAWEKVEKNLTERLTEAQTLLALAQEKERTATEKMSEIGSRCTALEASNSQLRQEKAHLAAQQASDHRRIDMLEERKASDVAQLELAKQKLSDEVASLRRDKVFLESQLETERSRLEAEKQRVAVAEEQIRILERERPRSRGTPSPVSVSRQESMNSSLSERSSTPTWLPKQEEGEGHFLIPSSQKTSLYDSMRQSGAAALIENLQSQLKLKEGEIAQLQAEIQQLERTRESMARELVNLTNLNEELQEEVKELPKIRTEFRELDSRYNALLQMYGEKEEKVQELLLDLEDVKEMYKQQINALMQ